MSTYFIALAVVFVVVLAAAMVALGLAAMIPEAVYAGRTMQEDGSAIAASGDNVYLTWPSNKTGNWEVLFRASKDAGNTFADKVNLSNSSDFDNTFDNSIAASGENSVDVV